MLWISYLCPIAFLLVPSIGGTTVAVDETLGKAMCKQMVEYKMSKVIQPALKDQDDFPEHEGCAWIHWKQCTKGKDCSTFSKKTCTGGGGETKPPPPGGGGPVPPVHGPGSYKVNVDLGGNEICYMSDTNQRMNQEGAEILCKKSNGGLISIETERENAIVGAILLSQGDIAAHDFWTSGNAEKKTWKSTGKAFEFTDPTFDQSQGSGACMTVSQRNGQLHWNKKPCDSFFPLCEMSGPCPEAGSLPVPIPPEKPALPGKGVSKMNAEFDDRKICYVIDTATQVSSDKAESYCSSKGFGHALSIETQNEQAVVEVLLLSHGIHGDSFWTSADLKGNIWKESGKEMSYTHEHFSKSNGGDCMTINPQAGKTEWQSTDCGSNHNVFCEVEGECVSSGGESSSGGGGPSPPPLSGEGGSGSSSQDVRHSWLSMSSEVDGAMSCYLVDTAATVTMQQAREMCKAESSASLLSIESESENKILEAFLSSVDAPVKGFWTSADLSHSPQKWTSTGKELAYTDPSLGQGSGNCLSVVLNGGKISWVKTDCNTGKYLAFCERKGECGKVDSAPPDSGNGLPDGVTQLKATIDGASKCYTTKTPPKDCIEDADEFCKSGGFGRLVSVETKEEEVVVRGLLQSSRISRTGGTELGYWTSADLSSDPPKWSATGKPFEYTPSNFQKGSSKKCMIVVLKEVDESEWLGADCDTEHLILCEADGDCNGSSGGGSESEVGGLSADGGGPPVDDGEPRPLLDLMDQSPSPSAVSSGMPTQSPSLTKGGGGGEPTPEGGGERKPGGEMDISDGDGLEPMLDWAVDQPVPLSPEGSSPPAHSVSSSTAGGGGSEAQRGKGDQGGLGEGESKPEGEGESKPETGDKPKPAGEGEPKPETGGKPKPEGESQPEGEGEPKPERGGQPKLEGEKAEISDGDGLQPILDWVVDQPPPSSPEGIRPPSHSPSSSAAGERTEVQPGISDQGRPGGGGEPSPGGGGEPSPGGIGEPSPGGGEAAIGNGELQPTLDFVDEPPPSLPESSSPPAQSPSPGQVGQKEDVTTTAKDSGSGRIHISGTLSKGICKQMKAFKSSKKIQEPLDDKEKYASGADNCSWYQWHQCQESRGDCSKFQFKTCDETDAQATPPGP